MATDGDYIKRLSTGSQKKGVREPRWGLVEGGKTSKGRINRGFVVHGSVTKRDEVLNFRARVTGGRMSMWLEKHITEALKGTS